MKIKPLLISAIIASLCTGFAMNNALAKIDKQLPPGLQKKVDRGQALPSGWQMKLAKGKKMDEAVYKKGEIIIPINEHGEITLRVDDKVVRLYKATKEIIEILK